MDFFEVGVGDVGVDLGGTDVGMAEHGLDGAKVGAIHKQISSETVAKRVRRDVLSDTGEASVFFDNAFDTACGDTTEIARCIDIAGVFGIVKKKWGERIGAGVEIILNTVGGRATDENRAVFAAFATHHELATFQVDRAAIEIY